MSAITKGSTRKAVRTYLWERSGGRCFYCRAGFPNKESMTVDHYVPKSRGGKDERSNYRAACADCNQSKGALLPIEFDASEHFVETRLERKIRLLKEIAWVRRAGSVTAV